MRYYVGLDISDATTNLCLKDEFGAVIHEMVVDTTPNAILSSVKDFGLPIEKIGMETGAKSNWLCLALSSHYNVACYNSWKVAKLISARGNKTDKNDAQVIAEIVRLSCFSDVLDLEVHIKSPAAQEIITLIRARESTVQRSISIYNQIRAIYKTHGYSLPHSKPECFTNLITETINQLPDLVAFSIGELIAAYDPIQQSIRRITQKIEWIAKQNYNAQLLMSIPEVGSITSLYFAACIDDPKRFSQAKSVGSYFGLVPLEYSSGQKQHQGSISKRGDPLMRNLLVGVARRTLQHKAKSNALKKWGQKKEKKLGANRAAIALARHLAVIMAAMLIKQAPYVEPTTSPPQKGVIITTEDFIQLAQLSKKNGGIVMKSIKTLKKLAKKIA